MDNNKPRVLMVEDDLVLASLYKTRMEMQGYTVLHCVDGKEALEKINEFGPNLILLDIMTPKIGGFEVIEKVRAAPGAQPKIVVLTALSEAENKDRAMKLGADEYLVKSGVALNEVLEIVQRVLGLPGTPLQTTN
jgi:DNA-binding response OmpR family regulator